MRASVAVIAVATTLAAASARAQCQSDQDGGTSDGGCGQIFTVTVPRLPQITGAPLLEVDAIIQDDGAIFAKGPGVVFVTVRGPSDAGGGVLVMPDGGIDQTLDGPLITPLSPGSYRVNTGVFTTFFDGGTSLFLGDNAITVSAVEPSGARVVSAPQIVRLDLSFDGGSTGSDGGPTGGGTDGGFLPDGGPANGASPALVTGLASSDSAQGCSTTNGGPPSFLLMALAVMLAGLGRRAMRG
jgi:uncharacterized protein (TIGR03382 family)